MNNMVYLINLELNLYLLRVSEYHLSLVVYNFNSVMTFGKSEYPKMCHNYLRELFDYADMLF